MLMCRRIFKRMISTFLKTVISLFEVFIPAMGIFVLFLTGTNLSVANLVNEKGTNSPQISTFLMKNISIRRTSLLNKNARMLIGEKTDIDSLPTINESHKGINEPDIEKNIPDIRIGSIENKENIEGSNSEDYGKMLHSIVKKHQSEYYYNMSMYKNQ